MKRVESDKAKSLDHDTKDAEFHRNMGSGLSDGQKDDFGAVRQDRQSLGLSRFLAAAFSGGRLRTSYEIAEFAADPL